MFGLRNFGPSLIVCRTSGINSSVGVAGGSCNVLASDTHLAGGPRGSRRGPGPGAGEPGPVLASKGPLSNFLLFVYVFGYWLKAIVCDCFCIITIRTYNGAISDQRVNFGCKLFGKITYYVSIHIGHYEPFCERTSKGAAKNPTSYVVKMLNC